MKIAVPLGLAIISLIISDIEIITSAATKQYENRNMLMNFFCWIRVTFGLTIYIIVVSIVCCVLLVIIAITYCIRYCRHKVNQTERLGRGHRNRGGSSSDRVELELNLSDDEGQNTSDIPSQLELTQNLIRRGKKGRRYGVPTGSQRNVGTGTNSRSTVVGIARSQHPLISDVHKAEFGTLLKEGNLHARHKK